MAIVPTPEPGDRPPVPPPPFPEPKPVREPDPDRLPGEDPLPNPDEYDNPPRHAGGTFLPPNLFVGLTAQRRE